MTAPRRRGVPARPLAEVLLLVVHLTVALGFGRLFDSWSFAGPLLASVAAASALAVGCRRARLPAPAVAVLAVLGAGLVTCWTVVGHTTAYGVPTGDTVDALRAALSQAREAYPVVVAPTAALPGFLVVAGLALAASVWFADWTAFRLRATVEAVAPATALFVFCSLLGSGRHRIESAVGFAAAVLAFVAVHRADRLHHRHPWEEAVPRVGGALARSALVLGLVAASLGALAGPRLPGADAPSLVAWRNRDEGGTSRLTVSPLVELRKRLVDQSDQLAFTVRSPRPAYWRLTALDRFDGQIWSSSGEFRDATDDLPSDDDDPTAGGDLLVQQVEVSGLSAIWVPAAFAPVSVRSSSTDLRWDPDSSTLIVGSQEADSDGIRYTVVSRVPDLDPAVLRAAEGPDPADVARRYLELPRNLPRLPGAIALDVTRGEDSRYDQALALQRYFRTHFRYSLDVPAGHDEDALVAFLRSGSGYCEQFAGAFAAMARTLGIPARVAVGFTPGARDPDDPQLYRVSGRHAHAWPEVFFPGVGWVPFEPTPSRGNPTAEEVTGVPPAQDEGEGDATPTTTAVPSTTTASAPTSVPDGPTAAPTTAPRPTPVEVGGGGARGDDGGSEGWLAAVAVAALVAVAGLGLVGRRRRRRAATRAADPVVAAWEAAIAPVRARTGTEPSPTETHGEYARRVGAELEPAPAAAVAELAELVAAALWSPPPRPPSALAEVEAAGDRLRALLEREPVPTT
jgi:transglutaminase-like putative cysteine protease